MSCDSGPDILRAVEALSSGGLLAYPTETVYGLGCDPFNEVAFQKLKAIKGREGEKPMLLIASSIEQVRLVTGTFTDIALQLAEHFWPGPLTMILPPIETLPRYLTGPGGGVAIRVTSSWTASAIADSFGKPVVSTSANKAGMLPAATIAEVRVVFGNTVDYYIGGDEPLTGLPSTIVDVMSDRIRVLREGAVSEQMLEGMI